MEEQLRQKKLQDEELRILEETKRKEAEYKAESSVEFERDGKFEENVQEIEEHRKQPLFKASIGGIRPMHSQPQHPTMNSADAEDLDGQCTPAGPIPKSKGGPVPLMSLEIKPPSPQAVMSTTEESIEPAMDNSSALPKALEQALALKTVRANEMGVHPEAIAQVFLLFLLIL